MISELERVAIEHGDRMKVISIEHLQELRVIIEEFGEKEELNKFQKWIVNEMYQYELPEVSFKINSIILIAIHHPFYARVDFHKDGEKKTFLSLVPPDYKRTEEYLRKFINEEGYFITPSKKLPVKRLGAHSGLAKYGRNNITYIDGLGSNFSYVAYFTDMICKEDSWGEMKNAEACNKCILCTENCPTGAIRKERFLIDNQRCISCINEAPGDFPEWIPMNVHHALYDCLICQRVCPMNSKQLNYVIENIFFSEEETKMLLAGKPIDTFSEEAKAKIHMLGINDWYNVIPRNLKVLFEQ